MGTTVAAAQANHSLLFNDSNVNTQPPCLNSVLEETLHSINEKPWHMLQGLQWSLMCV